MSRPRLLDVFSGAGGCAADACAFPDRYFDFVGGSIFMPVWFAAFGPECVAALNRVGVVRVIE